MVQLLRLPASLTVVNILESYVKTYTVNVATLCCVDRPARLTRSTDDDKLMASLDNKYVNTAVIVSTTLHRTVSTLVCIAPNSVSLSLIWT